MVGSCSWTRGPRLLLLPISGLLFLLLLLSPYSREVAPTATLRGNASRAPARKFNARQLHVAATIRRAYESYQKCAWGQDEVRPMDCSRHNWGDDTNESVALTIIESLDTLWLAGHYDLFNESVEYLLSPRHSFDRDVAVSLFETTIRIVGGLLSAYELSGMEALLDLAVDMGRRLLPCFGTAPLPAATVNLKTGEPSNPPWAAGWTSLSEVTTLQLEFKKLSMLTGDPRYDRLAMGALNAVLRHTSAVEGLFPQFINAETGEPAEYSTVSLGSRSDSFYEYLVKLWILTGKKDEALRRHYVYIADRLIKALMEPIGRGMVFVKEIYSGGYDVVSFKMDHLVCFVVGMLQLGVDALTDDFQKAVHRSIAAGVARTCSAMYSLGEIGLAPEIVRYDPTAKELEVDINAPHNLMRPEALEAMYYMSRASRTKAEYDMWVDRGWAMYESMMSVYAVGGGFSGVRSVLTVDTEHDNLMQSFFMAETLKYAFLLVSDYGTKDILPLDEWVFNTEGHPLRIMK